MRVTAKQLGNVTRYKTQRGTFYVAPIKEYWTYGYGVGEPRTTFFEVIFPLSDRLWRTVLRDRREAIRFIELHG